MIEFVLIFRGKLSTTSYAKQKFEYRRQFKKQLEKLKAHLHDDGAPSEYNFREENRFIVGPFTFLPLVTKKSRRLVDLDITLLSEWEPGCNHNYPTGDIDNLLKQLLDGLRMAQNMNEVRSEKPHDGEKVFLTVLEDDQQVRSINIHHYKNLNILSKGSGAKRSEIMAIIKVKVSEKYCH